MAFLKLHELLKPAHVHVLMRFTLVFAVIFITAKFGQYLYFEWDTSPAILWPPIGIGVAVIWLFGYRYAVPIFLGLLLASLTGPVAHDRVIALLTPISQIAGQLLGVYLFKRFEFAGEFTNIRTVLVFFLCIVLLAVVSPLVIIMVSYYGGGADDSYLLIFSRIWAGYAFSCLILTPFIIAWTLPDSYEQKNTVLESVGVGALLTIATYLLFWTILPADYSFVMFALFFLVVIWVCLRYSPRIVTLTAVYITVFGIVGLFLSPAPGRELHSQLFAAELFLFIVVPIMYAYSALVKERQKNLKDLELAFAKIEQENANKSNFIAVLAHELRNPLAPIKSTLEILKLQKLQPEIHQLIGSAHNQINVMRRLLDDLLDVTRVTQGKFELKTEPVQLLPLIQSAIEATKNIVNENGHTLVLEKKSPDLCMVRVDPIRFEQVLVNVINNAAKFTPSGGRIKVSCAVIGSSVELRVEDNGKGIAADNLEQIFNSFWQIKDSEIYTTSGIGVGLALARQIVELHNGTIRAESKGVGQGSTFIISIPCVSGESVVAEVKKTEPMTTESYSILVVDDNKPAADALAHLLTIKGHTARVSYTGKDALQKVVTTVPDAVLLDIGLPDMSGYDVAKNLRKLGFAGALIALSGYGQQDDVKRATDAGFDIHFTKPTSAESLEAFLQTWKKRQSITA